MKPILFAKNETNFTTNGLGRLDCISCEVVEERNGMYELEAEIPITGAHANEIEMHSIIGVIPHEGSNIQAFYVYKIGKPISGRFRVYGRHISYRLTDIPCMPFSVAMSPQAADQTLAGLKSNAIEACPFNFYTDITTPASYTQKTPASIRQRLGGVEGSVIDQFGGEFEWDNWNVRLLKARGRLANVTGISLRYGKNITDLDQEEEIASTVTGVVPFWVDTDGNNLVTLPEHAVYAPTAGSYPYHLTQVLDLSSEFRDKPTVAQLRNTATLYVNKYGFGVPKVSIKVSFVDLWKSEEYKDIAPLEQVKLCDEITVDFEKLGVKAIAKVVKTTYDVLKERYTQIEVGSIRTTLAQAITDRDRDIDSVYLDVMSRVTQAAQNATAWLTSANGYVVAVKNTDGSWKELLFMDSNDPATARNCLRINNNGLGFWSHDRYPEGSALNGPYDNAWTIDGNLIADFITTGDLKSQNYEAPTQATSPYAVSGMDLALNNGNITSEYFVLTQLGAFLKGTIEAIGGRIGAATIDNTSLTIRGDFKLYNGSGTYQFRPIDYGIVDNFVLAFQADEGFSGSATATIIKHTASGETTEDTITITDDVQHTSVTLLPLDVSDSEQYYKITVSGTSLSVSLYDTILAYMGQGGFRGVLQGIFKGYLESNSGIINGLKYSGSGDFFGEDLRLINDTNEIHLEGGTSSSEPTIKRTYNNGNADVTEEVAWGNKQNYIEHQILPPSSNGREGDLMIAPASQGNAESLYRYENNEWVELDLTPEEEQEFYHTYSSEEHKVGTWINGNDVYEVTIKLNNLPSNTSAQYAHGLGGFGNIIYYDAIRKSNNVFTDLLCNNDIDIDDTYITVTSHAAQSGSAYITIGYTKPSSEGYYTNNRFYAHDIGFICSGWYASANKTVVGDCYSGMIVGLNGSNLTWTTFCISLLQSTVQGMAYRYELNQGTLPYNGQTWYYSYSRVEGSIATSTNLDNTQPTERRFYIGDYSGDFVPVALTQLLDSIYS